MKNLMLIQLIQLSLGLFLVVEGKSKDRFNSKVRKAYHDALIAVGKREPGMILKFSRAVSFSELKILSSA